MLALTGYTDRFSAPPGGRIAFRISSAFEEDYQVDLVRIIHGDPNLFEGRHQKIFLAVLPQD